MCVMVAVLKSDDIMTAVTTATDADSQPLQDLDANKPGVWYFLTVFLPSLFFQAALDLVVMHWRLCSDFWLHHA